MVNDLLEGAGRFTIIKRLANAEGSLRYFWGGKKPEIDCKEQNCKVIDTHAHTHKEETTRFGGCSV